MQAQAVGGTSVVVDGVRFPIPVAEVLRRIGSQHESLQSSIGVSRLAVNQSFADADTLIRTGDEVALIGLISGG